MAYAGLMLFQRYHSVIDILTSAACVGVPCWAWMHLCALPGQGRLARATAQHGQVSPDV